MQVKSKCKNENKKRKVLSLHSLRGLHGLHFGVTPLGILKNPQPLSPVLAVTARDGPWPFFHF